VSSTSRDSTGVGSGVLPNLPLWVQGAASGVADVAESVVQLELVCPAGPVPLAARGLAAVLARASPAGGGGRCVLGQGAWWLHGLVSDSIRLAEILYFGGG
jgi:hypothetical protein